ncbi:hypothetical protein HYQ13_gp47 [Lactococcus phage CHPC52]|uniref:Uncharacterized protein n=1 Tax=Lactococcus phage CHPC52 TaxID=2675251 RepID=A0A650ET21_9CAUD|nr:hypothetical protein HYQ13_gp47 [Lactococcus phage CHPC52]QGT53056.1 hypothetical protein CHPC52_000713 [Lactococcus phage CHPC52]
MKTYIYALLILLGIFAIVALLAGLCILGSFYPLFSIIALSLFFTSLLYCLILFVVKSYMR